MKIAIGGASGLIGRQLVDFLSGEEHEMFPLVRRPSRSDSREIQWDPARGELAAGALEQFDAVIHLGGVGIADERWSAARKSEIRASRVESTRLLAETIARLRHPPRTFLCASAIGYYGDRGDEILDESAAAGAGFLSEVCAAWENAAAPASQAGVRVVHLRTGLVLSASGGALGKMLTPFRMGMGGKLGSGRQWMSWIAMDDLTSAVGWLLNHPEISGPVNMVAPGAVTNNEFAHVLGHVLRRPTFFGVPTCAVKLAFGEMGEQLLLASQRVTPRVLQETGYKFKFEGLERALRHVLAANNE